ncbi:hypothetical protein Barb7_01042 [Bacteroidales bacterium Barb7]|nr:hypothetical protein Barb7_01042 [Bacteroidales bacterium Barb7]
MRILPAFHNVQQTNHNGGKRIAGTFWNVIKRQHRFYALKNVVQYFHLFARVNSLVI